MARNSRILIKSMQVESLTNQEEVELRAKIKALGLEVTKIPSKSTPILDEVISDSDSNSFLSNHF